MRTHERHLSFNVYPAGFEREGRFQGNPQVERSGFFLPVIGIQSDINGSGVQRRSRGIPDVQISSLRVDIRKVQTFFGIQNGRGIFITDV